MPEKSPYGHEEPEDGEGGRTSIRKPESEWRKVSCQGHLRKRPQNEGAWARNANIPMSLAGLGKLESLTETPSRDCNVLAMCPI